jgi:hypothetical protein
LLITREWEVFAANMQRVLPGAKFFDLTPSDPIFNSFFEIASIDDLPQYRDRGPLILRGVFEDNDPQRRMMAMVNFNTDIANYWKYAATGFKPIEESNEGYKLALMLPIVSGSSRSEVDARRQLRADNCGNQAPSRGTPRAREHNYWPDPLATVVTSSRRRP